MFPFYCGPGGWWFLPLIGIVVFMMLVCFLFRRVFRRGAFCCRPRRIDDMGELDRKAR